jgi:threonine dehydrogenase-like Zn-dependent dehydrogenase
MIASGRLAVPDLIPHKFPREEFAQALDTFVNRCQGTIKVVVEPNAERR